MNGQKVLEMNDVSVRRGNRVILGPINFSILEGERWVILGPNGAGKSTLLQILGTRIFPTAGQVSILDKTMGKVDLFELRTRIGICGALISEDIPYEEKIKDVEKITEMRKQGKESVYELSLSRKDGTMAQVVISGAPTFDVDGRVKGSIGIHWDVTEVRKTQQDLLNERITREQQLLETKLQAEEQQRSQIGRDLHDGVGQMLAYMQLYIGLLKTNQQFGEKEISQLEKTVDNTIQQVRTLSRTLAPPSIRDLGLREAIMELVESYSILQRPKFHLKIYSSRYNQFLRLEQKIMIYRVLQELISNTFKYADADNIRIKFSFEKSGKEMMFEYEDDGKGFDLSHVRKGVGLESIRSRVEYYKGTVKYDTAPGKGMIAVIVLPVGG